MPILHWLNREESIKETARVPYRLLKADTKLSYGDEISENMLIQGDNLDALKALLPYYAGKVKCIFIDPPYNTKSAFEHYDDNLEHTKWLEMMYPRLELLRELLSEDGSIWVTLDDNEVFYLKVIMDEVFGRKNFITSAAWQKIHSIKNDARLISVNHDFVLTYSKNIDLQNFNLLERTEAMNKRYKNPDDDPRGPWSSGDLVANEARKDGNYFITGPTGREFTVPADKHWVYTKDNLEAMIAENRIWFGVNGSAFPRKKRFLSEVQQGRKPDTWWLSAEVGHNQEAKREARAFNNDDVFTTPKPERLIQRILQIATNENDLVLDSFLGSGTTSAVAHKMNRRYIGIEMGDHAKTHCAARLQKVIDGEPGGISKDVNWQGGGGFRFYHLGEAIFDEDGHINPDIKFPHLAAHIWFSETRTPYTGKGNSPLLGIYDGVAYYLLYNGILGDKRVNGGNVLTSKILDGLPDHPGPKVIYGETSRLGPARLHEGQITFKQTPYDIKAR